MVFPYSTVLRSMADPGFLEYKMHAAIIERIISKHLDGS
jgi:hypothetical protein